MTTEEAAALYREIRSGLTDPRTLRPCRLCGGDGYVSEETARYYRRYPDPDRTCPECGGKGCTPSD
jgi:DnaJ-class molecular chaperone